MPVQAANTVQTEIIEMISETAEIDKIGLLSPDTDNSMTFSGGKQTKKYLDGSDMYKMNIQILGKGADQLAVAERLCGICNFLTYRNIRKFPKTNEWEIRRISIEAPPSLQGQEENGEWFYSCVLSIVYFYKPRKD